MIGRRGRRLSIQFVLVTAFVLIASLAVLTIAIQQYAWLTGELLREELEQDLVLARAVARGVERYMTFRRHEIAALADEIGGTGLGDPRALVALLEAAKRRDPAFSTLLVTDRHGVAVAFSPPFDGEGRPNVGRRYADRRWFQEALAGTTSPAYDVVVGRAIGAPTVAVAAPIRWRGQIIGVVGGGLNLDQLRSSVRDLYRSGSGQRLTVVDSRGRVIGHASTEWEAQAHDLSKEAVFQAALGQGEGTVRYVAEFSQSERWAAYVRLASTGWVVWTVRGPESQAGKVRSLLWSLALAGTLALAVAATVAFVVGRLLSRPILTLAMATNDVAAQRFDLVDTLRRRDSRIREFNDLFQGFGEMAEGLRLQHEDLEAKVAERTRALERATREAETTAARLKAQDEIQRGYGELAALLNSLDRSFILTDGTRKIAGTLRAPLAAVYLTEDGPAGLRLKTYTALDSTLLDTSLLSPGGLPVEAAQRKETVVVATPLAGERLALRTGVGEVSIAAVAALPLQHQDRLLGILAVALLEPMSQDTRRFLESAAGQLSVAISNATLFESVRHQSQRMEQLNEALRRASEAKSRFLSSMSHELRTPLNSIIGFTDLLLMSGRDPLTDRQRQALEKVGESGKHLLGLINQVLDLAKIEAGRVEVRAEPFPLAALVHECLAAIEPQAQAKALGLRAIGEEAVPEIRQDRGKVKQILLNLLSNAVKFTPAGFIEVRVHAEPNDSVAIVVADTGPGIRPEDHEAVFDEFRQVGSASESSLGTGLGLPISRRLATLLGGTLALESLPGRGSTFTLRLPRTFIRAAGRTVSAGPEDPAEIPGAAARILVIDDDRDVADIVRGAVAGDSFHVQWAGTAAEGLAHARSERPRAILLDVMLQGQDDGWEVLRTLKGDPLTRDIPVVLHSVIDNPERARQLGADEVLLKPVTPSGIQRLLYSLLDVDGGDGDRGKQ